MDGAADSRRGAFFSILFGAVLGVGLVKFGNPIILDRLVETPHGFWELLLQPWPISWGYAFLVIAAVCGLLNRPKISRVPLWVLLTPLIWLGWQCVAAAFTIDANLTRATLPHFAASVGCFYLGLFCIGGLANFQRVMLGIAIGLLWVIWFGFDQHYGGLEATRQMIYAQPGWENLPREYLLKIASNRIFSTLVYPNALAGAIILLLPCSCLVFWNKAQRLSPVARGVLIGVFVDAGLVCFYWTGSKAGWLIAVAMGLVALFQLRFSKKLKFAVAAILLVVGMSAFFIRFSDYFQRGATSVGARFEYWKAAAQAFREHPVTGVGPGAYSVFYRKVKPPEAEMAKLVHNDYLEQASDSGTVGFLAYSALILGSIGFLYRKSCKNRLVFATWLGFFGWSLQAFAEFALYIPALAWPAFAFLGWLWSVDPLNEIDSTR